MFIAMVANFIPILAPANQMNYDTVQFYNAALAIVAGCGAAALAFRLLPPLPPAVRTRRLLALTLRDLRRLATGPIPPATHDWEQRISGRLVVLPEEAEPLQRAQLLAALSVGSETIRLRRLAVGDDLDGALEAWARGDITTATARLARLDHHLAAAAGNGSEASDALRARASILAISDALSEHDAYFSASVRT
jgi:uncharacterized membrane protein YccC